MTEMLRFYRKDEQDPSAERCFYVETADTPTAAQFEILHWLIGPQYAPENVQGDSFLTENVSQIIYEHGPRLTYTTPQSTNAVAICTRAGIPAMRIESSRRVMLSEGADTSGLFDRMLEEPYEWPLTTFDTGITPEGMYSIPVIEEGVDALRRANTEYGWGMDEIELSYYADMFARYERNPTIAEGYQLAQANSNHCRHKDFTAEWTIDGQRQKRTLMQLVKMPLEVLGDGVSVIAFHDNGSAIRGAEILTLMPEEPGKSSRLVMRRVTYHVGCTVETHNHPSLWEPYAGAATGDGGEIRDQQMTGRGSLPLYSIGGYAVGSLDIPGFVIPGELVGEAYPDGVARPLHILVRASDGYTRYANEWGLPAIQGMVRTGEIRLPNGERRGYGKPIVLAGGTFQVDDRHLEKRVPEEGMVIMQVGGPAHEIGVGGGARSSVDAEQGNAELDFASVQRGDPEMGNKMNRVIRACCQMGDDNPILVAHDQGAGGPSNVLTEIIGDAGGEIHIRRIIVGDTSMPVVYIWVAEYQERNAVLVHPSRVEDFLAICEAECVTGEVLGRVTGDGKITVIDDDDGSKPVDLLLTDLFADFPQKKLSSDTPDLGLVPFEVPDDSIAVLLERIFRIPDVGSKGYLIRKGDRSVGGLVTRQQACGPLGLPLSNVAVALQSHYGYTGEATGLGEQPWKLLMNPAAGARMAVGEALQNLMAAVVTALKDVRCSVNWMAALKHDGEGALVYRAAEALKDVAIALGIAPDGGKDSMSMAIKCLEEWVKAPPTMVVTAYGAVPDVRHVVTPAIRLPGESSLVFIDIACGKNRLGGSIFAKSYGELGHEVPDMDDPALFAETFGVVQQLIKDDVILSMHDRSDGGLITTLAEMIMAGDCGADLSLIGSSSTVEALFSEELGLVLECRTKDIRTVQEAFLPLDRAPDVHLLGNTTEQRQLRVAYNGATVLTEHTHTLLKNWEAVSDAIEHQQMDAAVADQQAERHGERPCAPILTFAPAPVVPDDTARRHTVCVIREEGINGDTEMGTFFYNAGFEVVDVRMTDLLSGRVNLDLVRGIVGPGGFSYADVFGAAKGWAAGILFNPKLKAMFERFFARPDTFSFHICNSYQLMTYLGRLLGTDIESVRQPRLLQNTSKRFDARTVMVRINDTSSIFFKGMEGSVLPAPVAHGEGRMFFPDTAVLDWVLREGLVPVQYVASNGSPTELYPDNPNGSPRGIAGLCSKDGRHFGMMPHAERVFRIVQMEWVPNGWDDMDVGPWQEVATNARKFCEANPS